MSSTHTCSAFVVTCIDFRIQKFVEEWLHKNVGEGEYDRVAWAGGVLDLAAILKHLAVSIRLHHVKKAVLINHEDCGAYGEAGDFARHRQDLQAAAEKIKYLHPRLMVTTYYVFLNGRVEKIA